MKLADTVAALGVAWLTEAALVLLVGALALVLVTTFQRRNRAAFERAARLPLEDEAPAPARREEGRRG